jgi:dihydroneopterin aldolase
MTIDCLHITGIRAYGYTGVLPEEKTLGQWYEVDLSVWLDLSTAEQSDRIEDTYDYRAIVQATQELIRTAQFSLIEKLAGAIADMALASKTVNQVKVRLTKMTPPIPDFGGRVTVEIIRAIH